MVNTDGCQTKLVSLDQSNKSNVINVKIDGSVLEQKSSLAISRLTFSSTLDWSSYIVFIAKTTPMKIWCIDLLSEVPLSYSYFISINLP